MRSDGGFEWRWCINRSPTVRQLATMGALGHDPGMNSRVHPKYKTKYRVNNWAEYDRALVQRGDITLWIEVGGEGKAFE